MLNYIITFFVLAVLAAFFGFGGLASNFASIAKLLSLIFIVLFVGGLIRHLLSRHKANLPL